MCLSRAAATVCVGGWLTPYANVTSNLWAETGVLLSMDAQPYMQTHERTCTSCECTELSPSLSLLIRGGCLLQSDYQSIRPCVWQWISNSHLVIDPQTERVWTSEYASESPSKTCRNFNRHFQRHPSCDVMKKKKSQLQPNMLLDGWVRLRGLAVGSNS